MSDYKNWTKEDTDRMVMLFTETTTSCEKLANIFNRSTTSIKSYINKHKLKRSLECRLRMRQDASGGKNNGMFGKVSPKLGRTKHTDPIIKEASKKLSETRKEMFRNGDLVGMVGERNPAYGKPSWSRGLTKYDHPSLVSAGAKTSIRMKERWRLMNEQEKEKLKNHCAKMGGKCKGKKTSIEEMVEEKLKEFDILYVYGYQKGNFVFDFYLPIYDVYIECNGDYWHVNPKIITNKPLSAVQQKNIERDKRKSLYVEETIKCNKFIILWESDIRKNLQGLFDESVLPIINTLK